MSSSKALLTVVLLIAAGCRTPETVGAKLLGGEGAAAPNVVAVKVGTGLCSAHPNVPCASVTLCEHNSSNCQTIDDIQIDTGSVGLRLFRSLLAIDPALVSTDAGTLAECETFDDAGSVWGPIALVDLVLGGEPATQVPVQLIDFTFGTPSPPCSPQQSTQATDPSVMGMNGVLGLDLLKEDCGPSCATDPNNGQYLACTGANCKPTATTMQLQNPVGLLPIDNNGLIVSLPAIPAGGAPSVTGKLLLGIGTRDNNQPPANVTVFPALSNDLVAVIAAVFPASGPKTLTSFFDSGSNVSFFPGIASAPPCVGSLESYLCPPATQVLTATISGGALQSGSLSPGTPSLSVSFPVANAQSLAAANPDSLVFNNLAAAPLPNADNSSFIWGLTFFYGKNIYFGLEDRSSPLGSGRYFAF